MKLFSRSIAAALALVLTVGIALAQTSPNLTRSQVPTAAQWNGYFIAKQDTLGYVPLNTQGGVMLGRLVTAPPSSTTSGFNLTCSGSAPASPVDGDQWCTSAGLFVQIGGSTVGPLSGPSGGSFAATAPLDVTFPSGVTTYSINFDSSLTNNAGSLGLNLAHSNSFSAPQSIAGLTVTGALTATGLVTNADLANPSTAVNGQTCTLGGACTVTVPISTGVSGLGTGVSAFLATPTSANLAAAVTDETGTGSLVFAANANLTTPAIGAATATSINKVTITPPATSAALTIANGKTLTANNTLTFSGTDGTTLSLPGVSSTLGALSVAQTWSAAQSFNSGDLKLNGSSSGSLTVNCAAACGTNTLTLPAGTTNFSATGGAGQYVKQSTSGGALTVATIASGDLPLATSGSPGAVQPDGVTITVSGGVITANGASATAVTVGSTSIIGGTAGNCLSNSSGALGDRQCAENYQPFSASGTFTTPSNSTTATVYHYRIQGAGGGGGGSATSTTAAGGGGAGGYAEGTFTGVAASTNITITVGSGGTGGPSGTTGNSGGASSIGAPVSVTAGGGNGGVGANTGISLGGSGGTITGSPTVVGLIGAGANPGLNSSGGVISGGSGASSYMGVGGRPGSQNFSNNGLAASGLGAGGGGAFTATSTGGAGSGGIVIIDWVL